MVKNVKGGSRHKKQARKHANEEVDNHKTRLKNADEKCEVYGVVKQMYGQGNCEVMCSDTVDANIISRLGIIRRIFKGRNKHSNRIAIGTLVLVGLREWETKSEGKREKCDILEVYNNQDIPNLKKDKNFNQDLLKVIQTHEEDKLGDGNWEFMYGNKNDDEEDDESQANEVFVQGETQWEFNIDDI